MVVKLVCNINPELLARVDAYASSLSINRTAAVSVLLTRALQAETAMSDLSRLMDAYDRETAKKSL